MPGVRGIVTPSRFYIRPVDQSNAASGSTLYTVNLDGAIAPSGALSNQGMAKFAGATTPVAVLVDQGKKFLSGFITPSATLTDQGRKFFVGSIAPIGSVTSGAVYSTALTGSMTPSGSVREIVTHALSGSVTPTGSIRALVSKALIGTVTPTGTITKLGSVRTDGAVGPAGSIRWQVEARLAGIVGPSAGLSARGVKIGAGSVAPSATVTQAASLRVSGAVMSTGGFTVGLRLSVGMAGTVTPSGSVSHAQAAGPTLYTVTLDGSVTPFAGLSLTYTAGPEPPIILPSSPGFRRGRHRARAQDEPQAATIPAAVFVIQQSGSVRPEGSRQFAIRRAGLATGFQTRAVGSIIRTPPVDVGDVLPPIARVPRLTRVAIFAGGTLRPAGTVTFRHLVNPIALGDDCDLMEGLFA